MLASLLLSSVLVATGALAQTTATASLIAELDVAPDHVDRVADLPQDSEFLFDFFNPPSSGVVPGAAGHLVLASVSDFPALVGNGIALLAGFLGPCGMNTPHTHPRAAEFLYQVNGSIQNGMLTETGSRFIINNVTAGQGMILPQGSIHFQFNDNCEPVQFVSALNSEDPGTLLAAQSLFGLPPSIVAASLGEIGVEEVGWLAEKIPDDVAFGSQECLTRCGISVGVQPTAEQVPRVSGNALPTGSGTPSNTWQARATSTVTNFSRSLIGDLATDYASTHASMRPVTIALIAVVGVMGLGYVVLAALFFTRRGRKDGKDRSYVRPDMAGRTLVPTTEKLDLASEPYDPVHVSLGARADA
ncbi:RmlC-like cupin [Laetiporus sulphureus 93-53]|uniref:RmlC-like cupin n=1 Tax=Laetiporus sulphureus 93-53 TaxID=1314785 RepID=A0A165I1M9_9APHY|nr:RmlC-like cupin [Laetiporus sulphureus 93-53]KZT12476.1 RmlC-like cupin [Laetiporus sulphureus 93-53]